MHKYLVVLDDSRECLKAMQYAAMCASKSGGGVTILSVIPRQEFQHWIGVGDIMSDEARERIEVHFEVFAKWMRDRQNVNPELVIRKGDVVPEIMQHVQEDKNVAVLVLGAGTSSDGPGPLVSKITRSSGNLAIPITIVPGQLSKDQLDALTSSSHPNNKAD